MAFALVVLLGYDCLISLNIQFEINEIFYAISPHLKGLIKLAERSSC